MDVQQQGNAHPIRESHMGNYLFERRELLYKRMEQTRRELEDLCNLMTRRATLILEHSGMDVDKFRIYHKDGFYRVSGLVYSRNPIAQNIALRVLRRALRVEDEVFEDNDIRIRFDELMPLFWHLKDIRFARGLDPRRLDI
jgi:hypothetical protein